MMNRLSNIQINRKSNNRMDWVIYRKSELISCRCRRLAISRLMIALSESERNKESFDDCRSIFLYKKNKKNEPTIIEVWAGR